MVLNLWGIFEIGEPWVVFFFFSFGVIWGFLDLRVDLRYT